MNTGLVWFRRDLRSVDHAALYHALRHCERVYCAFVFDTDILAALPRRADRRVEFILASLIELDVALHTMARRQGGTGAGLIVRHGPARECIPRLAADLGANRVFTNRDYEPAAIARDRDIAQSLADIGVDFVDFKDQVIFDRAELLTQSGGHFRVFTPYLNAWRSKLNDFFLKAYPVEKYAARLAPKPTGERLPALADIGFEPTGPQRMTATGMSGGRRLFADFQRRVDDYARTRDYPAVRGGSALSVHLRFGTVSIRELAGWAWRRGGAGAATWLAELAWRDFYQMILWRHPHVVEAAFRPEYQRVAWLDAPEHFAAWCEARTGYPIVDAALRQLHQTGFMHNRLRMVVASFLTKDLQIDWRRGERHFAEHLLDYDLAANNGGWQWAASTGCDAQPWFRIFNPVLQSRKFDPDGEFIRRYVPELQRVPDRHIHEPWTMSAAQQAQCGVRIGTDYPAPIVDHAVAREQTLLRFGRAVKVPPGTTTADSGA